MCRIDGYKRALEGYIDIGADEFNLKRIETDSNVTVHVTHAPLGLALKTPGYM